MIIDKIHIAKFHGFNDVGFSLGNNITIIAGQNATQKSTLLGLMSQPFTINKESDLYGEKPLCGGTYKSGFSDKFKLSPPVYDKAGDHEWTLSFLTGDEPYTVISIWRDQKKTDALRFWKKGSRDKGTGYLPYPVIFLSLKRLIPLAEESTYHIKSDVSLDEKELELFKSYHNDILYCFDNIIDAKIIDSPNKTTLGLSADKYDWMQNSAGQDNVGKILLALLSFRRLKENHKKSYKGGLLFIDELDATMYPGSQRKLLQVLREYSTRYNIQVVFTTHSLTLLKQGYDMMLEANAIPNTANSIQIIYLEKKDGIICIEEKFPYAAVENRLQNTTAPKKKEQKVTLYTEDVEAVQVTKALLAGTGAISRIEFSKCKFGNGNLINLMQSKLPFFLYPESIIIFDGDVKEDKNAIINLKKIKRTPNWLFLPSELSPERLIARYLNGLSDFSPLWVSIDPDYNRKVCFDKYKFGKIMSDRNVAKLWFQQQSNEYSGWCAKIIKHWRLASDENKTITKEFVQSFVDLFNNIAGELRLQPIKYKRK